MDGRAGVLPSRVRVPRWTWGDVGRTGNKQPQGLRRLRVGPAYYHSTRYYTVGTWEKP